MLVIMGNALRPTQQLFVITMLSQNKKSFLLSLLGDSRDLPLEKWVNSTAYELYIYTSTRCIFGYPPKIHEGISVGLHRVQSQRKHPYQLVLL